MSNKEILGMDPAHEHAKQCTYGANMSISAALVVDMVERIAELEKALATSFEFLSFSRLSDCVFYENHKHLIKEQE